MEASTQQLSASLKTMSAISVTRRGGHLASVCRKRKDNVEESAKTVLIDNEEVVTNIIYTVLVEEVQTQY